MTRATLAEIALLATPFLLFFLYRAMVASRRAQTGAEVNETPYQILFFAGSALAVLALVGTVLSERGATPNRASSRDEVYIPPRVVDGQVQAGRFVTRDEAIAQGLIKDRPEDRLAAPGVKDRAGKDKTTDKAPEGASKQADAP
jgi:hypothetical protein